MIKVEQTITENERMKLMALQEWKKEHQKDNKAEIAEDLLNKLDYMHMCW